MIMLLLLLLMVMMMMMMMNVTRERSHLQAGEADLPRAAHGIVPPVLGAHIAIHALGGRPRRRVPCA
jgi:uncharacterized integral membrane protein